MTIDPARIGRVIRAARARSERADGSASHRDPGEWRRAARDQHEAAIDWRAPGADAWDAGPPADRRAASPAAPGLIEIEGLELLQAVGRDVPDVEVAVFATEGDQRFIVEPSAAEDRGREGSPAQQRAIGEAPDRDLPIDLHRQPRAVRG
mgnify:CR=1 FL=1